MHLSEWLLSKSLQKINSEEGMEKREPSTLLVGMENSIEGPLKNKKIEPR